MSMGEDSYQHFTRRWSWLRQYLESEHERSEAERLATARAEWFAELKRMTAEVEAAQARGDNATEIIAGLAKATQNMPQTRRSFDIRIMGGGDLDPKARECVRDCLTCYRCAAAARRITPAMDEFARWFGHRIAADPDWSRALSDMTSGGDQHVGTTPLRDIEIAADVGIRRSAGVVIYDNRGKAKGWKARSRECAIDDAQNDWPGVSGKKALERREKLRRDGEGTP